MGFYTELISRPRPREDGRYRAALAVLNLTSGAQWRDDVVRPADFPKIARRLMLR